MTRLGTSVSTGATGRPARDPESRTELGEGGSGVSVTQPAGTEGPAPLVALRSAGGAALIAATVLASLIGFLDAYVVNVAVPAIGRSLHASVASLQWTLTSYLLAVAALLLLSGALADHFGRRRVLAVGLLIMLVAAGFVDTLLSASLLGGGLDERRAQLRATLPIGRVVGPADIAALAVHLMANTALTGGTYDIDGGQQLVPA
jgi:MFS family permease